MKRHFTLSLQICFCIFIAGLTLYAHINKNNEMTAMQLAIPKLEKEVRQLQKQNERLQYEIDRFESPLHLMELLRKPEFGHLKYPRADEVVLLPYRRGDDE